MKILPLSILLLCCGRALAVPVTVSVVDSSQKPVEGALLRVASYGAKESESRLRFVRSDARGQAQLDLNPSQWNPRYFGNVIAFKQGLAVGGGSIIGTQVTVALLAPVPRGGKITDKNGQPVAGAKIEFSFADASQPTETVATGLEDVILMGDPGELATPLFTRTDAKGQWTIEALPPRSRVGVNVRAPGFASTSLLLENGVAQKPLVLAPGANIKGRVVGIDGAPVAGVLVRPFKTGEFGPNQLERVETDATGNYSLDGLEVGAYTLRFSAKDESFVVPPLSSINARAGQNSAPDAKAQAGVLVRGTVRETGGAPIQTSIATDDHGYTSSDDKGNWQLRVLPGTRTFQTGLYEGKYRGERETKTLEIKEGEAPTLDWSLAFASKLRGVFVDEKGAPVETALYLQPIEPSGQIAHLKSDAKGHFETSIGFEGQVKIASAPGEVAGYEAVRNGTFTLPFNGELRVVLRRVPFKTFETKVVDQDGNALAGVKFEAILWKGQGQNRSGSSLYATSDENGVIRFDKIEPDRSPENPSASKPGFDLQSPISIIPKGDGFTSAPIVFVARDGQAQGQVLNADGTPAAKARVCAAGVETLSDEQGRFRIEGLSHGAQDVCALSSDGKSVAFARGVTNDIALKLTTTTLVGIDKIAAQRVMDELINEAQNTGYDRKNLLKFAPATPTDFAERVKSSAYLLWEFRKSTGVPTSTLLDVYFAFPKASSRLVAGAAIVGRRDDWKTDARAEKFVSQLEADAREEMEAAPNNDEATSRVGGVLAAVAAREVLGQIAEADLAFDIATRWIWPRFSTNNPSAEDVLGRNIGVFSFAPRTLGRAIELLDPESYAHHSAIADLTESLAASRGLEAARPFLEMMVKMSDSQPGGDGNRYSAKANYPNRLKAAIVAGGAANPALALQLAQAMPATEENLRYDYRAQAIAEAAFFQDAALAKTLWREQVPAMQPNTVIRYAARLAPIDAALSRELYDEAREKMDAADPNANKHIWYLQINPARFALDEAAFSPARARYRLEKAWPTIVRDPEERYALRDFVVVMGRVDVERALEMAKQIPPDTRRFDAFEARLSLAQQLHDGPAKRND